MQLKILKQIKISADNKVSLFVLNDKHYLIISFLNGSKIFILLPSYIISFHFEIKTNTVFFYSNSIDIEKLEKFSIFFLKSLKDSNRIFRKKLILKGLGYKATLLEDNSILELKLGFSHLVNIFIPKQLISAKLNKQTITFEGSNKVLVGNIANKVRQLRLPDNYKGKGVWYKNETRSLKELKKK